MAYEGGDALKAAAVLTRALAAGGASPKTCVDSYLLIAGAGDDSPKEMKASADVACAAAFGLAVGDAVLGPIFDARPAQRPLTKRDVDAALSRLDALALEAATHDAATRAVRDACAGAVRDRAALLPDDGDEAAVAERRRSRAVPNVVVAATRLRGTSASRPRRRRDPFFTEYPRSGYGVAATRLHECPRPRPRRRRDPFPRRPNLDGARAAPNATRRSPRRLRALGRLARVGGDRAVAGGSDHPRFFDVAEAVARGWGAERAAALAAEDLASPEAIAALVADLVAFPQEGLAARAGAVWDVMDLAFSKKELGSDDGRAAAALADLAVSALRADAGDESGDPGGGSWLSLLEALGDDDAGALEALARRGPPRRCRPARAEETARLTALPEGRGRACVGLLASHPATRAAAAASDPPRDGRLLAQSGAVLSALEAHGDAPRGNQAFWCLLDAFLCAEPGLFLRILSEFWLNPKISTSRPAAAPRSAPQRPSSRSAGLIGCRAGDAARAALVAACARPDGEEGMASSSAFAVAQLLLCGRSRGSHSDFLAASACAAEALRAHPALRDAAGGLACARSLLEDCAGGEGPGWAPWPAVRAAALEALDGYECEVVG